MQVNNINEDCNSNTAQPHPYLQRAGSLCPSSLSAVPMLDADFPWLRGRGDEGEREIEFDETAVLRRQSRKKMSVLAKKRKRAQERNA